MNTQTVTTEITARTGRNRSMRLRHAAVGLAGLAAVVTLAGPLAGSAGAVVPRPADPFGGAGPVVAPPTLPPTPPTLPPVVSIPPVVVVDPGNDPAPQPTTPPAPQPTTPPAPQPTNPQSGNPTGGGNQGQRPVTTTPEQGVDAAFADAGIVPTAAEEAKVREVAEQAGRDDDGGSPVLVIAGLGVLAAGVATGGIVLAQRRRQA